MDSNFPEERTREVNAGISNHCSKGSKKNIPLLRSALPETPEPNIHSQMIVYTAMWRRFVLYSLISRDIVLLYSFVCVG